MSNAALFVDLSSNNAPPSKRGLRQHYRAGHRVLALKATESTSYTWHERTALCKAWHALGGVVWHYHFARPGDAAAQASYFLSAIANDWRPGDKLVLDAEIDGVTAAFVRTFIATCHDRYPRRAGVVYSYSSFLTARKIRPTHGWGLWLAAYGSQRPKPVPGWASLLAWQFADNATGVAGVGGSVDCSHLLDSTAIPAALSAKTTEAPQVDTIKRYAKAHTAALGALATWCAAALQDGHVSNGEWTALLGVAVAALGVAVVPNKGRPAA